MSKTIPIWTCVMNRAIVNYRRKMCSDGLISKGGLDKSNQHENSEGQAPLDWDCSLHLPLWVSETERSTIEKRLESWTHQLEASGADISSIASCLRKPLRPLWVSQRTVIWLNEVPDHDSWDFTPIILVSASCSSGTAQHKTTSEFSWNYIAGAGDDEESWARGLSPSLFWENVYDIIESGPALCNRKVADIVEKHRVYLSQRGHTAPQVKVKGPKLPGSTCNLSCDEPPLASEMANAEVDPKSSHKNCPITWLGSTNLAMCSTQFSAEASGVDCILNCSHESISVSLQSTEACLHLPMLNSKQDRFSLLSNLQTAVNFARSNLSKGKTFLICCQNGEDISVCTCLAILMSLFDDQGTYDDGKSFSGTIVTKWEMRRRLVYICKFATNARPSRGNLKQVFNFLTGGGRASSDS
ncbi:tRNA A64-2'-O-ribosylphosphate transferase isoform X2 [Rhodamnia argentea]|nr:tRNA A64-2'-O-ribosylphosphate transferase isoform X2 [Rhodamnia argentea]